MPAAEAGSESSASSSSGMTDGLDHHNPKNSVAADGDKGQCSTAEKLLCDAALSGDAAECLRLLQEGEVKDVNWSRPGDGNRALHLAAELSHADVVRVLIAARADPEALNKFGLKPIALVDLGTEVYSLLDGVTGRMSDTREARRVAVTEAV
mmetsp:Transcript_57703/g.137284  ORF Transcript_57703/g.137284 Transcript_57703/m.137284 type:complete len:152 (+) Transcript_57703:69-524(+)